PILVEQYGSIITRSLPSFAESVRLRARRLARGTDPDLRAQIYAARSELTGQYRNSCKRAKTPKNSTGKVYLLGARGTNRFKIGFTRERKVEYRARDIAGCCPYPLEILAFRRGSIQDERALHRLYAAERVTGEWFELSPQQVTGLILSFRTEG